MKKRNNSVDIKKSYGGEEGGENILIAVGKINALLQRVGHFLFDF